MPYDPRPTDKGGNRGIDVNFSRKAPRGMFRVVGVDTFDGGDWVEKDLPTLAEAKAHADEQVEGKEMLKMHVYDDKGNCVYSAGQF